MVGLNDSCPCCGHKPRRPALDRSSSLPSHFVFSDTPEITPVAGALPSSLLSQTLPRTSSLVSESSPLPLLSSVITTVPDNGKNAEEGGAKVETGSEKKNKTKRARDWKGESIKIIIKCKCGSAQKFQL